VILAYFFEPAAVHHGPHLDQAERRFRHTRGVGKGALEALAFEQEEAREVKIPVMTLRRRLARTTGVGLRDRSR
jgi:hypothetical protein